MQATEKSYIVTNSCNQLHTYSDLKKEIKELLLEEARALIYGANHLSDSALTLIQEIINCQGKIIFSGVGKSGLVGKKIAATFSSLGIPSITIHPTEALHGDLGVIQKNDFFIGLSKSGKSIELLQLIDSVAARGTKTALITCTKNSSRSSVRIMVSLPFKEEVCRLKPAPTSSALLMMAFGDALAVVSSNIRGFTREDYAHVHPAGDLGKTLSSGPVKAFMRSGTMLPLVAEETLFRDILNVMTEKSLGLALVMAQGKKVAGIITDGDLRRAYLRYENQTSLQAKDIMTPHPACTHPEEVAYLALKKMEELKISCLVVLSEETLEGIVHLHDLVQAGLHS